METTKDSIDWSHVRSRFNAMSRDEDGYVFLYDVTPSLGSIDWLSNGFHCKDAFVFASYSRGTCDWKDSLVERPKASEE